MQLISKTIETIKELEIVLQPDYEHWEYNRKDGNLFRGWDVLFLEEKGFILCDIEMGKKSFQRDSNHWFVG